MDLRGLVGKRVRKWRRSLVWNRVRIWRTGRYTPTENSEDYLPPPRSCQGGIMNSFRVQNCCFVSLARSQKSEKRKSKASEAWKLAREAREPYTPTLSIHTLSIPYGPYVQRPRAFIWPTQKIGLFCNLEFVLYSTQRKQTLDSLLGFESRIKKSFSHSFSFVLFNRHSQIPCVT